MNREDVFKQKAIDFPVETLAWGTVRVRELRGDDLPTVVEILESPAGPMRLARLVVLGCSIPKFEPGDEEKLVAGPLEPLTKVANAVLERGGLGESEKKSSPQKSIPATGLPTNSTAGTPTPSWPEYRSRRE